MDAYLVGRKLELFANDEIRDTNDGCNDHEQ